MKFSTQQKSGVYLIPTSMPIPFLNRKGILLPLRTVAVSNAEPKSQDNFAFTGGSDEETYFELLQERKILVPMAYWQSKGLNRGGKKTQANPYKWCKSPVSKILAQQEYCGDVINFKTFSKSFKNKTRLENDPENWAVFKDVHEPIIDRETFEQVQKLIGKTRRRKPKDENYERNMFCDLLYCADCGRKLWFNIKHDKTDIPFFSCGNYHGNRDTCKSTHYLRADAIE